MFTKWREWGSALITIARNCFSIALLNNQPIWKSGRIISGTVDLFLQHYFRPENYDYYLLLLLFISIRCYEPISLRRKAEYPLGFDELIVPRGVPICTWWSRDKGIGLLIILFVLCISFVPLLLLSFILLTFTLLLNFLFLRNSFLMLANYTWFVCTVRTIL